MFLVKGILLKMNMVNMGFNEMIILGGLLLGPLFTIGLPVLWVMLIVLMLRRSKRAAGLSAQELDILTQLEQSLGRLEQRIENLEVILEDPAPGKGSQ